MNPRALLLLLLPTAACKRSTAPEASPHFAGPGLGGPGSLTSTAGPASAAPAPTPGCVPGAGKTYDVGPGKAHEQIGAVPWEALGPGDTVRIFARPEPYREKVLVSTSGAPGKPIHVCGVPDASGRLPVLEGENAVARKAQRYAYKQSQTRGLFILGPAQGYRWGDKPSHVLIEGLELRGAKQENGFTGVEGEAMKYVHNAAALFIERAEDVTIVGCVITDSGNGFFVASGNSVEMLSRRIVFRGNWVHGNGVSGAERQHNAYTESEGMVYEWNRFGPPRAGALGNAIKDRSSGTVIRYNWLEGGTNQLDLVEAEDSQALVAKSAAYRQTFVYGNVLVSTKASGQSLIHYGGDNGLPDTYRKGTLHVFHNTFVARQDEKDRWATAVLRAETDDEAIDFRNNVVLRAGTTHLSLGKEKGRITLGPNWVSKGVELWGDKAHTGKIEGESALIRGENPGFVDFEKSELAPRPDSPLRGKAGALAEAAKEHPVLLQYKAQQATAPRAAAGAGATLGAFE